MKIHSFLAVPAFAVALTALQSSAADSPFYVRGSIGPAFVQDAQLEGFFSEPVSNNRIEFDPGIRFDAVGGYQATPWFAAEVEMGFIYGSVKSVEGTSDDDLGFSQSPIMVNAVFQLPNKTGLVPFIGGGGGMSINSIYADDFTLGGTTIDGGAAAVTYIYQAFGGLRYDFNPRMSAGLIYKYSVTGDSDWEPEFGPSGEASIGGLCTHSITAAFTYRF